MRTKTGIPRNYVVYRLIHTKLFIILCIAVKEPIRYLSLQGKADTRQKNSKAA